MELKWLEDFLVLAEMGSFSRAAEARNVTQPAFGRRIRALEHWLGGALIDRDAYPMELTLEGRVFRESAGNLVRELYRLRRDFAAQQEDSSEGVSFAMPHVLAVSFLPRWLRAVQGKLGPFNARVVCDNVLDCIQRLNDRECDFFIGFFHPQIPLVLDPSLGSYITLGTEKLIPYCGTDSNGAARFALPGSAAQPVPYLSYGTETFLYRAVDLHLNSHPVTAFLSPVFSNSVADTLLALAVDGQGIAWLPESLVTQGGGGGLVAAGDESWHLSLGLRIYRRLDAGGPLLERIWSIQPEVATND